MELLSLNQWSKKMVKAEELKQEREKDIRTIQNDLR